MEKPERPWRVPLSWMLGIFGLALSLRLLALYGCQPVSWGGDERFYRLLARRVAAGQADNQTIFMPGWPFVLSFFSGLHEIRLCPVLFGSITPAILYLLGRRTLGELTGRLAGLLLAVYPDHIFFSTTLYAETALDTLLLGVTAFAFWPGRWDERPRRDAAAAFLYGVLILFKHFAIVPFAAFVLSRRYSSRSLATRVGLVAAFFLPLLIQGAARKSNGQDPFIVINAPIKSMREWEVVQVRSPGFVPGVDRQEKLMAHLSLVMGRGMFQNLAGAGKNMARLWSPGTYVYRRSFSDLAYERRPWWFPGVHLLFYFALVGLGIFGISFAPPSPFRTFSVLNLLFASALSLNLFMMSRYRTPFMFPFYLYAADFLLKQDISRASGYPQDKQRWLAFAASMIAFLWIWADRLPHLRDYQ